MKKILAFMLTFFLAIVLIGCEKEILPTSVEITGAKDMVVGDTLTLTANIKPADAILKTVKWSSSATEIATVDGGKVKALQEGTVEITVVCDADENVKDSVTIKITKPVTVDPTEIKISGIADIELGKSIKLVVEVVPANASKEVTFSSSNDAVATVDENGNVKGISLGEAEITVTSKAKAEITKVVNVKVVEKAAEVLPESIKVTSSSDEVIIGQTCNLTAEVLPSTATNKDVTWSSSNEKIATVSENGVVTAVSAGSVTITATSKAKADVTGKITLTISEEEIPGAPEYIQFYNYKKHIKVGETLEILYYLYNNDEEITLDEVIWSVDKEAVATIENGVLTAHSTGTVKVTAKSAAKESVYSTLSIEVVAADTSEEYVYDITELSYTFKKTEFLLHESITSYITKNVEPSTADNTDVCWESSDTSVVKISATYRTPYIVGEGECTLTVYSCYDPNISADYTIVVKPYDPINSFKVVDTMGEEVISVSLEENKLKTLKIEVDPETADPNVTYTSSDESVATVSESGQIKAIAKGNCNITVTSKANSELVKVISVEVKEKVDIPVVVESVTIECEKSVTVGYKLQAKATVSPLNCPQGVTWELYSGSKEYGSIDAETGLITTFKEGTIRIRAISDYDPTKKTTWFAIQVTKAPEPIQIGDLDGYEIVIMNADSALQDNDPFYSENGVEYTQADKIYKQKAWDEVQKKYNCKIVVKAYPATAPWGQKRIDWIIENATNGTSECDLGIIPTNWIPQFGAGNAAVDVKELYDRYGMGQMEPALKTAGTYKGKLFVASTGISQTTTYVSLGLFYNYGWLKELNVEDPATLFNNGEWIYSKFISWVKSTQALLGEDEYVLQGSPYYYWFGMTNAAGIQVVDPNMVQINIDNEKSINAAAVITELAKAGCINKPQTWAEQTDRDNDFHKRGTLMTTGDLWFVRNSGRWTKDMWGDGTTEYAYVPFPYPDNMNKEDTRISVASYSAYMYIAGRNYPAALGNEGYKKVWGVMNEMFLNTITYQEADSSFDAKAIMRNSLKSRLDNEESIEAVMFYDAKKVLFDPAHGIFGSVSETPLKSAANNVLYEGNDYIEEFEKVRESFETAVKKFYAS